MLRRMMRTLGLRRRNRFSPSSAEPAQSGAIPYVFEGKHPVYLLITSRRTGRWIFPKGVVEADMTPAASAAKEAWEEAGVRGEIEASAVGVYRTLKVQRRGQRMIEVHLHPLQVTEQTTEWPEKRSRRRRWATHRQARRLIENRELIEVLDRLHDRLTRETASAVPKRRQPRKAFRIR